MAKICATGTDATWSATEMCAVGKIGRTVIAVGSYTAGNNTPRQELTTITVNAGEGLGRIMDPSDEKCNKVRNMSVVFPYHLHESMEDHNWDKKCLRNMEKTIIMHQSLGKPIHTLVMELMLAGNGAILSSFFKRIWDCCVVNIILASL